MSLPTFYRVYQLFIEFTDFFHFYWLLNYVVFSADFYRLFPTLPTVNRKFLITNFRLLSTSVKPKNFINFYRSKKKKKKMKHPRCLVSSHFWCHFNFIVILPFYSVHCNFAMEYKLLFTCYRKLLTDHSSREWQSQEACPSTFGAHQKAILPRTWLSYKSTCTPSTECTMTTGCGQQRPSCHMDHIWKTSWLFE